MGCTSHRTLNHECSTKIFGCIRATSAQNATVANVREHREGSTGMRRHGDFARMVESLDRWHRAIKADASQQSGDAFGGVRPSLFGFNVRRGVSWAAEI